MGEVDATATSGVEPRGYRQGTTSTDSWDEFVVPVYDRIVWFSGRANTFLTPGRATASQVILALHNAASSPVMLNVNRIRVDQFATVSKIITTVPPIIRCYLFGAFPIPGTVLPKTPLASLAYSNAAVTAWGDASADGTSSTVALTLTPTLVLEQVWSPRLLAATTGAVMDAYENIDTGTFFEGATDVTLYPGEGLCVSLEGATTGTPAGNPTTDRWVATIDWDEFTRP